jgi:hypothetical protein
MRKELESSSVIVNQVKEILISAKILPSISTRL